MKRADLRAGVVYAYRTHDRYQASPRLLLDTANLWASPARRGEPWRRSTDLRPHRSELYGDSGYLVVRAHHDLSQAEAVAALRALPMPDTDRAPLDEAELLAYLDALPEGFGVEVVNNRDLPGTWDAVAEADRVVREADAARQAELDDHARGIRQRFAAARETVSRVVPGMYVPTPVVGRSGGGVEMRLDHFEAIAVALAELAEYRQGACVDCGVGFAGSLNAERETTAKGTKL